MTQPSTPESGRRVAKIGPETVRVLGSKWKPNAPWAGLHFDRAVLRMGSIAVAGLARTVHNAKTRPNVPGWDGSVTEPTVRRDRDMGSLYTPVLAYLSPAGKRGVRQWRQHFDYPSRTA